MARSFWPKMTVNQEETRRSLALEEVKETLYRNQSDILIPGLQFVTSSAWESRVFNGLIINDACQTSDAIYQFHGVEGWEWSFYFQPLVSFYHSLLDGVLAKNTYFLVLKGTY